MKQKNAKPKKFRQNTEVTEHYHPRGLARKIVQNTLKREGATGLNKTDSGRGVTQSQFATSWRDRADYLFGR
jgi:hypothetical protein